MVSSCQTLDKRGAELSIEEQSLRKKIEEWEGYMRLIDHRDISIKTFNRLTQGYLEAKEVFHKKAMEVYEERLFLYSKGDLTTEPIRPEQDYSSLIKYSKRLAEQYGYADGADTLHYILGYSLYEYGKRDEAAKVFEDLVTKYPWSDYLVEVSFRLGEFYFETGQIGEALEAYTRILEYPGSIFYDKASYKLAWVYYKLDEFEQAIEAFVAILDKTWEGKLKEGGLMQDALSGIIMSFSHFKDMNRVIEYLKDIGFKGYTPLILARLGDLFVEETRYGSAISIYKALAEFFPDDPSLPFIYDKTADLYDITKDKKAALTTRQLLVNSYNPATSWYKQNYPKGSDTVDALVSKTLLSVSKTYHLIGKNEGNFEDIENAIKGYRNILLYFNRFIDYKRVNLLLAEALFDAAMHKDAALQYNKAAVLYPEEEEAYAAFLANEAVFGIYKAAAQQYEKTALLYSEGMDKTEAAYSAFLTYEVMFDRFEEARKETIRYLGQVLESYRLDFSKIGRLEKMLYRMADMYTLTGDIDKARETLMSVTKGKEPIPAYRKIAELYLAEGDLGAAEKVYVKLLNLSNDLTFRKQLARLRYKIAEGHLEAGRHNEAAKRFDQTFNTYPGFEVGEAALIKLGNIYIQENRMDPLQGVVKRLVEVYPDSDGGVSLLVKAGRELEKGAPLKAAAFYEDASAISIDAEDTGKLMFASALLYESNGKYKKAEDLFKRYILMKNIPLEDEAEARYRLGYIQFEAGRREEGIKVVAPLIEWEGMIDGRLVAKAHLLLLRKRQDKYLKIKLIPPFEETLAEKTLLLDAFLKDYSDIAGYGIPDILPEVFYQMGMVLENFRNSLILSKRPDGLTQEEMNEYDFLLEEKAVPYEEQAVKAYEKGVIIGRQPMIFNEWTEKSLKRLASLRPVLYKREFNQKWMKPVFIYPEPVSLTR
ncbi:MAG: tetratricopeptide repeat protein [Thermodesulfobacteriota bacterium]